MSGAAGVAPATGAAPAGPATGAAPRGSRHLYAVDVVRFLTVGGVIAVHSTSLTVGSTARGALAAGVVLSVLHVTREVFLFLTAFVLGHRYRGQEIEKKSFWKRRYLLVAVPYVVWSAIYVVADGHLSSPLAVFARYLGDLGTGGARFHLYFLLITFQLYAVFPWVLGWIRRARPWPLLAGSFAVELLFTAGTHYWANAPGPLGLLLSHPGSWLWSYEFYVVAGVLAAIHIDAVSAWTRSHTRLIVAVSLAALGLGMASYWLDMRFDGMIPVKASAVFQPAIVLESLAAIGIQYALGLWVEAKAGQRRRAQLTVTSDVSFGVYLAHPLLLQGVLAVTAASGLDAALGGLSPALQLVLVIAVLVPAVYTVTAMAVVMARRSPLSLYFTGRKGSLPRVPGRRAPSPAAGPLEPAFPATS